jgi:hypothetical protein
MFENLHVPLHYHNIQRMCCQNHVTNFTGFEALRSPFSTDMVFVLKILSHLYVSMYAFHSAYSSTFFNCLDFMNFRFYIFKRLS